MTAYQSIDPAMIEAAIETAPFGPEAHFVFPTNGHAPSTNVFDAAVELRKGQFRVQKMGSITLETPMFDLKGFR